MVAAWRGRPNLKDDELATEFAWLSAEDSPHAAVSYARGKPEYQPFALAVRLAAVDRPGRPPALRGAFKRIRTWELSEQDVPWCIDEAERCPSARDVWNWALGRFPDMQKVAKRLGVCDGH
jgi:hypothetical protein